MKNLMLAGAAALSLATVPSIAHADHHMSGEAMSEMHAEAMAEWPEDRMMAYNAWEAPVQEYYWTLEPMQQDAWWLLNDQQRTRVFAMTPEQRTAAWSAIMTQVSAQSTMPAATASTTAMAATTASASAAGNPRFVAGEVAQTAPARASGEEYPVCSATVTDSCINPYAVNKRGNKPLDYWPGKPASEM
ncbi:hypothetical protein ACXYN8_05605 [Altererythrobacter sp. CAU 1778]